MEFENLDLETVTVLDEAEMESAKNVLEEGKEAKAYQDELIRIQEGVKANIDRGVLTLREFKNSLSIVHLDWILTGKRRPDLLTLKKKIQELTDIISDYESGLPLIDREILKTRAPIERAIRLADKVKRRFQDEKEKADGTKKKLFVTL